MEGEIVAYRGQVGVGVVGALFQRLYRTSGIRRNNFALDGRQKQHNEEEVHRSRLSDNLTSVPKNGFT